MRRCRDLHYGRYARRSGERICTAWISHPLRKVSPLRQGHRDQTEAVLTNLTTTNVCYYNRPMANSIKDCVTMVNSVRDTDLIFGIGHGMCSASSLVCMGHGTRYSCLLSTLLPIVIHSNALLSLQPRSQRGARVGHPWRYHQHPAHRTRRMAALCAFVRTRQLAKRGDDELLSDGQVLPRSGYPFVLHGQGCSQEGLVVWLASTFQAEQEAKGGWKRQEMHRLRIRAKVPVQRQEDLP